MQREENMIFKRGGILSPWIRSRRIRIRNTGGNMIFSKYRYVKYRLCTTINYPLSSTEGVSGSLVQYNKKRDTFSFLWKKRKKENGWDGLRRKQMQQKSYKSVTFNSLSYLYPPDLQKVCTKIFTLHCVAVQFSDGVFCFWLFTKSGWTKRIW